MIEKLEWFRERGKWLKIDRIAKEIGVPGRTLRDWILGNRPLPRKWEKPLNEWIEKFM